MTTVVDPALCSSRVSGLDFVIGLMAGRVVPVMGY